MNIDELYEQGGHSGINEVYIKLYMCLQINIDNEESKSGLDIKEIEVIDVDDQTQKADENKENEETVREGGAWLSERPTASSRRTS